MRTVRRLYFYAMALIGAEAVVWGVVALLRTIISSGLVGAAGQLATGLSAVLVGLPVFLFHWSIVQRDAAREEEERTSRLRAIFLYGARAAFFIPVIYSTLALLNRWLALALGLPESGLAFGSGQTSADNLAAAAVCLAAFTFFTYILRLDLAGAGLVPTERGQATPLADTRRLYRYLWAAFGLIAAVAGVQGLLRYLLNLPAGAEANLPGPLASGLALTLVGAPLWAWTWLLVQGALDEPGERQSILRLLVLHLIVLGGVGGVLTTAGSVLSELFSWLLGRPQTLAGFLLESGGYIAAGIPLSVVWIYYGRVLDREMDAMRAQPRRETVRRLYRSILAALGLIIVFTGLLVLIEFIVDLALATGLGGQWNRLSTALAALGVGLPLWLSTWPRLQGEAAGRDDAGDRARRSVIRRAYLYLAVFALVIGAMLAAGSMFYTLIASLLGQSEDNVARTALQRLLTLGAAAAFLIYHLRALRGDGRAAQQSLGALHAAFPALILLEGEQSLAAELSREMDKQAPRLPVMIHHADEGAPDDALLSARVVVIPAGLMADAPEPLRLWLQGSPARRLILPAAREGWTWLGLNPRPVRELAREAAAAIRQMAEGEAPRAGLPSSPWSVVGLIFGGLFALQLLITLVTLVITSLWR
jgi:hypothetical protein